MENPAGWKRAELVISDALEEHERAMAEGRIGPSSPHFIADKLREAGLLADGDEPEVGWEGLRAWRANDEQAP